ncbi:hypothetical protein OEA41_010735 [Lepraria neglecta]|uniref:Uncharacterized protein n=1 Tax=Lepraria neglecta TaxID=209136 RepID=A0AAE0DHZ4_9LECA|nr:hypothetical protein OEA41_010735 [Lepraria neglecta]
MVVQFGEARDPRVCDFMLKINSLYYQGVDTKVHERVFKGNWSTGSTLPGLPLPGTSLAFVNRSTAEYQFIRGYYQEVSGSLQEYCWDGGWTIVTQKCTSSSSADTKSTRVSARRMAGLSLPRFTMTRLHMWGKLAACSFARDAGDIDVGVYYTGDLNAVNESVFRRGQWEEAGDPVPLGTTLTVKVG